MRWGLGVFVCSIGLVLVAGTACRNLPTSNNDRNRPPETYLTAAPTDSIARGGLTRIPYRYRAAWSGSDIDGEVVGFYVAVTETTFGSRLPPPKPLQYRFTTARESLFTFDVIEGRGTDREHGLYVYAVDNQGKVDPTPALTHFVARDRFLPTVTFFDASARGTIFRLRPDGSGVDPEPFTRALTDTFELPQHPPVDTIPSGSTVHLAWKGFDQDFGSYIKGYLYKLIETEFVRADTFATSAEYGPEAPINTTALPIGLNTFRIRAIDDAGGTTQPDALRRFVVNFSPDTWFAGPDTTRLMASLARDSVGWYFPLAGNNTDPLDFPMSPLGADSSLLLPAERPQVRTLVERRTLLDNTIRYYVRSEEEIPDAGESTGLRYATQDTIAFGSTLIVRFGGLDVDSPYGVPGGSPSDPERIFRTSGPNGSPVTFQARIEDEYANGGRNAGPFSTPFPNKDPRDPFNNNTRFYVGSAGGTGRTFVYGRAVDGDRTNDGRIGDAILYTLAYDDGGTPFGGRALRSRILTFYSNYAPYLEIPSPPADSVIDPPGNTINVVVRGADPDPDPADALLQIVNGYRQMFLAFRVRVRTAGDSPGPNDGWQDPLAVRTAPTLTHFPFSQDYTLQLAIPSGLATGLHQIEVELVDNPERTRARIVTGKVPFYWRVGP